MLTFGKKKNQTPEPESISPKSTTVGRDRREHPILNLQRTLGNQAVLRMAQAHSQNRLGDSTPVAASPFKGDLSAEPPQTDAKASVPAKGNNHGSEMEAPLSQDVPLAVREALSSPGHSLDGSARAGLETFVGGSLADVTVHTDAKAAESARSVGAQAYTVGNHIVFGAGQYRPGTLGGDALLAHEAAHVAQQDGGQLRAGQDDARLEHEANAAGMSFAMSLGSFATRATRGLKSGIRLQRCPVSARQFTPPSYFGPDSRATMATINNVMSAGAALQNWIAFGNAIAAFDDPLAGMHSPEAAEALKSVPTIIRARVNEEIDFLLLEHGNDLNEQEKTFWNDFRKLL